MWRSVTAAVRWSPSISGTREAPALHEAQPRAEAAEGLLLWGAEQELFSADFAGAQRQRFQISFCSSVTSVPAPHL